jgi:hypothetical protein
MTHLVNDPDALSEYGPPYHQAHTWLFEEYTGSITAGNLTPTGVTGEIKASTEMEALDRIREAWPDVGAIRWTGRKLPLPPTHVHVEGQDDGY